MKSTTLIGMALIVLGIFTLFYRGFTYTTQEKFFDLGPIQATTATDKTIPLSPIFGVVALVGGITLTLVGSRLASKGKNL